MVDDCDSPRHPVCKLHNVVFCPRSLVVIGQLALEPETENKINEKPVIKKQKATDNIDNFYLLKFAFFKEISRNKWIIKNSFFLGTPF